MGNRYTCQHTFEDWCITNNRQDILELWDYKKNVVKPSEVAYKTKNKYYFKCPNGIHESEAKRLELITDKLDHKLICKKCEYNQDLTGMIFGELTVLKYDEDGTKGTNRRWLCKCSCGNELSVLETALKSGKKVICGGKYKHKLNHDKKMDDGFIDIYNSSYLRELRKSSDYYEYRKEVQKKDGCRCIVCGSDKNIEVHHIYPFATHPHDRLNPDTGICMCKEHHSVSSPISFHSVYGRFNNTPEQLEEYVNNERRKIGVYDYFDVYEYMNTIDVDDLEIDDCMLD